MYGLAGAGVQATNARTIVPSITLPSHTAMVTGLNYKNHGVSWNDYRAGYISHPTLWSLAKKAGLGSSAYFAKMKFNFLLDPAIVDVIVGVLPEDKEGSPASSAEALARRFAEDWAKSPQGFTFIHFREPDSAGHTFKWMSPEYLQAVTSADKAIGIVLEALNKGSEAHSFSLLVTSDHGGNEYGHGSDKEEDVHIPWIGYGAGFNRAQRLDIPVRTFDTAPTIMRLLGLEIPAGLDGRVIVEALSTK